MARISRKCLNELYYHVMTQGIGKEFIFKKENMKSKYYNLIIEKAKENNIIIVSYCIMDNHAHILARTQHIENLSKMMSQINTSYGKYYNKICNRVGYVFRDRYRAEPIFNNTHIENCIRYIRANPVKAGIVSKCENYKFSSFNDYQNGKIDSMVIKELYGNGKNYVEKKCEDYEKYDFIDISNEFGKQNMESFEKVSQEYSNVDFRIEENVFKISNEIKKRCNATNKEIIEFMGLKRATYYNIIKRQKG